MESGPLELSGIFDRAFALYVRAFAPWIGIAAAAVVPAAAVQYAVTLREQPQIDATLRLLEHPELLRHPHAPTLFDSPGSIGMTVASLLLGYLLLAFATGAVGAGVARLYRNERVGFRACYATVLPRWASITALLALVMLALAASYAAALVVVAIPVVTISLLAPGSLAVMIPFAATLTLLAILFAFALLMLVAGCGFCSIVVEKCSAFESLKLSCVRICNRVELGRALLCSIAIGAVAVFASASIDLFAFFGLSRWPALYTMVDTLARAAVVPFAAVAIAVYYFDLRVRQEGVDIETPPVEPQTIYAATRYLSGDERAAIATFLERRDAFSAPRRRAIASRLAAPVRPRVPEDLQRLDDESLLERL
jgi:hypothetical protein